MRGCLPLLALAVGGVAARANVLLAARRAEPVEPLLLRPSVLAASHNLTGYKPEFAADGERATCWLVPGGQRMEKMSHDKWLVFDLGRPERPSRLSILGVASTFGGARVAIEHSESPDGPWRRVATVRAMRSLRNPVSVELPAQGQAWRYYRLYIRREGHATFRHALHDVVFTCPRDSGASAKRR